MAADGRRNVRIPALGLVVAAAAVGCSGNEPADFNGEQMDGPWGPTAPLSCDMTGTWVTLVQVGVDWSSFTIKEGAGKVIQWILSERQPNAAGGLDVVRSCGIGATDVPLGSAWFSTRAFPQLGLPDEEWTGVTFYPELFDSGRMRTGFLDITMDGGNRPRLFGGEHITTAIVPFEHGTQDVPPDFWPKADPLQPRRPQLLPYMVDHDGDGNPGLTGLPFEGPVPGTAASFMDPRVEINTGGTGRAPARTNALYMGIRTRAQLDLTLTSCNPPRFEGTVVPGTLLIETANVACRIAATETTPERPCTDGESDFIDSNLPEFVHTGESRVISVKAPRGLTCARARRLYEEWE